MKRLVVAGLLVVFMLLYPGQNEYAFACSCQPDHPLLRPERNDAVFAGKVMDLVYLGQKGYVTIEVDMVWKGMPARSTTILDSV